MILINFTHPLTAEQQAQIEALTGQRIERLIEVPVQFDHARPFVEQVVERVEAVGLTPREWQTESLLVVPPALNFIAVTLMAELNGRMGYLAPMVRVRPVESASARPAPLSRYEVAEVIDLQEVREGARKRRQA
jgi:hypothetical protein